jgi:MFS family permease
MSSPKLPSGVVALGFVSLLMDFSSEMIHALLPLVVVTTLGGSPQSLGLLEGFAEATASFTKLFSGALSDRMGKRRPLLLLGYGMAALTKPGFAVATTLWQITLARVADRVGKGIRGAPRDALIADITPKANLGAAYGLRQSMDSLGAVLGPVAALVLMTIFHDAQQVFFFATIPAALAVLTIVVWVRDPEQPNTPSKKRGWPLKRAELKRLPVAFWSVVALAVVLTLARFSEAFLVLSSQRVGWTQAQAPWVLVIMCAVYTASAWPLGHLADRVPAPRLLAASLVLLLAADVMLAYADTSPTLIGGLALWGLHLGASQGVLSKLVAEAAPADLRGTAFGMFQVATACGMLLASPIAGLAWERSGPEATYLIGAGFTVLAGLMLVLGPRAH